MDQFPDSFYSARELAELDRRAADSSLSSRQIMEQAGRAAYHEARRRWPDLLRWLIYVGGGNNGGDGYVLARQARLDGFDVAVVALAPPAASGPAEAAALAYRKIGGQVFTPDRAPPAHAALVVDALFGIGLSRTPEGDAARLIEQINAHSGPVVALDIPSGLFADTGAAPGPAVRADLTVTFIGLKPGLFTAAGKDCAGEVVFMRLGVPAGLEAGLPIAARRIADSDRSRHLPRRARTAHKGQFGHVLVVGGDLGTGGATRLAGEAAQRTGAGLVSVLTRPEHVAPILSGRPELMVHGTTDGAVPEALVERATVIALGPGLGQGEWGRKLWQGTLDSDKPIVLDADGLNLLAAAPLSRGNWILTPHPGEAARLLDATVAEIEADRLAAVARLAERYNAVTVLKGAGTLIATADGEPPYLCEAGNPGLAAGGMGDALTGVIAGLLAQGLDLPTAARLGVWLHASAADRAAAQGDERGLLAGDLIAELRALVNP